MKVGIVTTWFERGAAYVSRSYARALASEHEVFIYARGGEAYALGDPTWDQPNVTWSPKHSLSPAGMIDWRHFRRWLRSHRIQLILFNEQQSWDVVLRCLSLPAIVGAYVDYYTPETSQFFWLYDFLVCNTKRHFGVFQTHPQALYVPWGTDCSVFQPITQTPHSDHVTFFHSAGMGGVNLRKGTDLLVRAFQNVTGNARLLIHSQVDLDHYASVAPLISNDPRIEFHVGTVKPPGLYHRGDVYVYPTRLEGIGLTIAEALASGLPVITTDCAPMNEFVIDNANGRLVTVEETLPRSDNYYWAETICSIPSLTTAMQFYIDRPDELSRHQQAARSFAVAHLDWSNNAKDLGGSFSQFTKLGARSSDLITRTRRYEGQRVALHHLSIAFAQGVYPRSHRFGHLLHGALADPAWLHHRWWWSNLAELTLGERGRNLLKTVARMGMVTA